MIETKVQVTLPEMGESVSEGSVVEWRVKPGGWIDEGATLVDVTTDKVDVEVPAPASGVVTALFAGEGDTVSVGKALAEIDTSAQRPASNGASSAPDSAAGMPVRPAVAVSPSTGSPLPVGNGAAQGDRTTAPPAALGGVSHRAARWAERTHLDLSSVKGSGPAGMVLAGDVAAAQANGSIKALTPAASAPAAAPVPLLPADARVTPLRGPAGALVGYMEQSLSIPTATSFRTVGVGVLDARRAELNVALKTAARSEKVSFTHVIAYALVRAAAELPFIAASFRRDDAKPARVEAGIHLGLAVDSERKDGSRFLVVPVIKDAAAKDFAAFRAAYEALVAKARDNALAADDLTGATFTLTNPGGIGTVASVPRLMAGQGAIIAAGAIAYPPGFAHAPGATLKQLGVEKVMTLTSTYDHRVIQGAQSGEYLRRIDQLLGGADGFYDAIFASLGVTAAATSKAAVAVLPTTQTLDESSGDLMGAVAAASSLVGAFRRHGHLAAHLDPLGRPPQGDPSLDPSTYTLTPAMMQAIPASILRVKVPGATLADVLPRLRETYTSTIAYELEHISNTQQREWLRDYIERGLHREPLPHDRKMQVLNRLTKTETMERYFRKNFMSQKTFSIEGLDMMVPMLEEMLVQFIDDGIDAVVLGMAHRGRLSTIAHVVNRPYEELLAEFEVYSDRFAIAGSAREDATGDVKYHHGASGIYEAPNGKTVRVQLANNPSHLEAVDGVVEGMVRCLQTDHTKNIPAIDRKRGAPILIHGDAAFSGQGVVAEVLNLQALPGYATGGTVHLIADNQIGFTTDPSDGRSTRYASDLAKGFDSPIVHVNADDVDACIAAVRLAIDFRRTFARDVIIDLIGYRRFGHNEQDEPAYTQPQMYDTIKTHPSVRELFASKLIAEGVATAEQVKSLQDEAAARIADAHKNVKTDHAPTKLIDAARILAGHDEEPPATGLDRDRLLRWSEELVAAPSDFTASKKLTSQFERRATALRADGEVDWGLAEGMAFAALLAEGTPIRLTGQDTERGTFSHRHAVLRDAKNGERYVPLQHISDARASFEIYNSPLSEFACLGFEYGYSTSLTSALVLWEAQFGDFNNGAQVIIDQFIAAGASKWGQLSRLTLLLPHGYEGAGPEHSSARLERFLLLSAEGNIRIANCSNAAQYFHLLRAQANSVQAFPLVVLTPKSLLRKKSSYGRLDDMTTGTFREVIDDPNASQKRDAVRRIILCSGKVYHDMTAAEDKPIAAMYDALRSTAIVRVELLSPFPTHKILDIVDSYPNAEQIVWVQEEPKNMGARAHVRRRLVEELPGRFTDLEYIGRPYRASPSEGYPGAHAVEQERIIREALTESRS